MIDERLAGTLKRIVNGNLDRYPKTVSLAEHVTRYNLGRISGKSIYFTPYQRDEIRLMLVKDGYNLQEGLDLKSMSRAERLHHTPNEKAGGGRLKTGRISIKPLGKRALFFSGHSPLLLPPGSHLDMRAADLHMMLQHDCILLVENYENFDKVHEVEIELPTEYTAPLVVYRGDANESRLNDVMGFIEMARIPVFAFVDIDPAGLVNISRIPFLAGIVAPRLEELQRLLGSTETRRADLYDRQYAGCQAALDKLPEGHPCKGLWEVVKANRAGLVQERWETMGLMCVVWR